MKKINTLNKSGFAHHLLVVLLIVLLAVGGVGYYVWQRQKDGSIAAKAEGYAYNTTILDSSGVTLKVCRLGNTLNFYVDTRSMSPVTTFFFAGFADNSSSSPSKWQKEQLSRDVYYNSYQATGAYYYATLGAETGSSFGVLPAVTSVSSCL